MKEILDIPREWERGRRRPLALAILNAEIEVSSLLHGTPAREGFRIELPFAPLPIVSNFVSDL